MYKKVYFGASFQDIARQQNLEKQQEAIDNLPDDLPDDWNPYDYIDSGNYKNTARGKMQYQEDLAKLLYMAQINQENRMNEYNSPAEQAKRLREAGINPDLAGVDNMPAQNVAGYQGNPMDGTKTTLEQASDVFGIISSATNIVGSLVSGASTIFGNPLGLAKDALALFESAPTEMDLQSFIESSPIPSRTKRRLSEYYNSYISSSKASGRNYSEASEYMKSKADFHKTRNNPLINPFFSGAPDSFEEYEAYTDALSPLIQLENDLAFKELNAKFNKAAYDTGRYNYEDGVDQRDFEKTQRDMYRSLRKPLLETINNLKKLSNKYPWATWAQCAVSAVVLGKLNF